MRLSQIHAAIEAGQASALPDDQALPTLVAIEHLAQIEGVPVSALGFAAPQFGEKYTYRFAHLRGSWSGRAPYLAWRNRILNAQMRFAPADVDADPWASLGRAERLWKGQEQATLYNLYKHLPKNTRPAEVTDDLLVRVRESIPTSTPQQLRAGVHAFRQLFENDFALRTGLLPDACPNSLPVTRDHWAFASMSPDIEAWRASVSDPVIVANLDYLNRLAVAGGRLNGETDTLDDLRVALCDLPDPREVGIPEVQQITLNSYQNRVRRALGGPDPRKRPAERAWSDLRSAARSAGCETSFLWALGKPAAARGLLPTQISRAVASEIVRSYDDSSMPTQARRGCEQFDALRGKIPPELLPASPLRIRCSPPRQPRAPKSAPLPDSVKASWTALYARLRDRGWDDKQLGDLSYLRVRASAAGVVPDALTQDFIEELVQDASKRTDRDRLRKAVHAVTELSRDPEFEKLPALSPPEYTKFTHGGAAEQAEAELEELMVFMNAAAPTRRAFRVAVGVLTDAMGRPDLPLKDILETDMSALDLGPHEPRRKVHTDKVRNLREFLELPWTPAWRALQGLVTGAGVAALENPVPKVLSWNPGTDPVGLTREWAQQLDRELRSTRNYPPHGRADIAKKLARHLAAFDKLRDMPAVARSGLMPPLIGPIR